MSRKMFSKRRLWKRRRNDLVGDVFDELLSWQRHRNDVSSDVLIFEYPFFATKNIISLQFLPYLTQLIKKLLYFKENLRKRYQKFSTTNQSYLLKVKHRKLQPYTCAVSNSLYFCQKLYDNYTVQIYVLYRILWHRNTWWWCTDEVLHLMFFEFDFYKNNRANK